MAEKLHMVGGRKLGFKLTRYKNNLKKTIVHVNSKYIGVDVPAVLMICNETNNTYSSYTFYVCTVENITSSLNKLNELLLALI